MTFLVSECSVNDIPILPAKCLIDRLKCAEPVKYINAHGYSSNGTLIISNLRYFYIVFKIVLKFHIIKNK
jgi:hypothetical protein